jgi:transcriptional regulator with XRE-family HTH domain
MNIDEKPNSFGGQIKSLRKENRITLKDISKATGLSVSFLSLVENGKSGISFSNMQKILKCFNRSIHDLAGENNRKRLVRFEEAQKIKSEADNVQILSLTINSKNRKMWPGLFTMEPGSSMGEFRHEGDECAHVIQGKVEVTLTNPDSKEEEKYILTEGDTIYYSSDYFHKYRNLSRQKSIFIAVCTPPTF